MRTIYPILLLALMSTGAAMAQETSTLRLKVSNFKNQDGKVRVAVYNTAEAYMKTSFREGDTTIYSQESVEVIFDHLPVGEYAITLYHDQNGNQKLDTNFMGIPTEPYGFSNNPPSRFGPPDYKRAVFMINNSDATHHIKLN